MYIDPHTEFRYPNDEQDAQWTLLGLFVAAFAFSLLIIVVLKTTPGLG